VIRSSFQVVSGVGPTRERALWEAGVRGWDELGAGELPGLPGPVRARLAERVEALREALAARDLERLATALPSTERWRLFREFEDEAVYLDIETDFEDGITAIGLLDRRGPRILLAGRDVDRFPEEVADARLLVTYNGASFDLPVLRRFFPEWRPPEAHVDLRPLWRRLGHRGGLKALEEAQGIGRPPHLRGLTGLEAGGLWRRARLGDERALRLFAEYNLYDTVNLRTLLGLGYNRMIERLGLPAPAVTVSHRGDVLYDLTRELMRIAGT
jgi:hypothetical protein